MQFNPPRPHQYPMTITQSRTTRLWQRLRLPLIGGAILGGSLMVQTVWLGTVLVILYGIIAITRRIPSRTTFGLAAVALAAVCAMLLLRPNAELIGNFSTYTFLLLIIGVIALTIEARPEARRKRRTGR